jgi:hypothetical protein
MKVIDITEKLNFEEKPKLKIKDTVIEVNNEAVTVLKIIPKVEDMKADDIADICSYLFEPSETEKLNALHLDFKDYMTVIQSAVKAITGTADEGETKAHTLT